MSEFGERGFRIVAISDEDVDVIREFIDERKVTYLNLVGTTDLLQSLGLPVHIFQDIVQPGTQLGLLLPAVADEIGLSRRMPVIAPGCHDTASAVAAVPVAQPDVDSYAYISSGTWSLVGAEIQAPVINAKSLAYNFTNEGGVQHTIRLLKNRQFLQQSSHRKRFVTELV